jgi:hypothetical protein
MKKVHLNRQFAFSAGFMLVFPALYFIVSAWLNYGLGFSALWKIIEPIFEKPGNKQFAFIINLLILFGPLLAIFINLPLVMQLFMSRTPEEVNVHFAFKKYGWSWIIIGTGIFCLAALFFYLLVENCNC